MANLISLDVSITEQSLTVLDNGELLRCYPVSTARNGPGETRGSECTPTGWHRIRAKIGDGAPLKSVFVGRRLTGEIHCAALAEQYPDRDWILTRILWLSGLEPGKNRFGEVDTFWRYIYIHGTPDEVYIGRPVSHGCIRMKNEHIVEVFDQVEPGCKVNIHL